MRAAIVPAALAGSLTLLWWRGPNWGQVGHAFTFAHWWWIVAALALNLLSVLARAIAWRTVIAQALPCPTPPFARVFSAFSIGLLANAVLPARAGELARVAVLTRHLERGRGYTATLLGTVFAHRLFDVFPATLLLVYVLLTAKIPDWAITSLIIATGAAVLLLAGALAGSRTRRPATEEMRPVRRLVAMARKGLDVLNSPFRAAVAILFQCIGWFLQLLAVYVAMRAFGIHAPLPAAGLVLLLMNVATIFPLWPGNIGLLQAAVALPLRAYGVPYARGFAFGLGLQILEMSVGVGVGLIFLAREGISFAALKRTAEPAPPVSTEVPAVQPDAERESARVPG